MKNLTKDSRLLSYILRHHPEEYNLTIDEYGYIDVNELVKNTKFTKKYLKEIVDNETRYGYSPDGTKIRAFHGHSISGIIYANKIIPQNELYHGTSEKSYKLIMDSGWIKGMSRTLVHLSKSEEKAKKIGKRHGKPVILVIDAKKMAKDGKLFYESEDDVILSEEIPIKYIKEVRKDS